MKTNGILANGTQFHKLDDAGVEYEYTFTDVTTGGEIGGERGEIEATTLESAGKEYVAGMIDNGEISLEMVATVENLSKLESEFLSGESGIYAVTFPTGGIGGSMDKKFSGFIKSCKVTGITPDELLKISASIRISGGLAPFIKPSVG